MDLEIVMQNELSQKEKNKQHKCQKSILRPTMVKLLMQKKSKIKK